MTKTDNNHSRPQADGSSKESAPESLSDLMARLESSAEGLSQSEGEKRIQQYGYNEIAEETNNPLLKFPSYFWNLPIIQSSAFRAVCEDETGLTKMMPGLIAIKKGGADDGTESR